MSSAITVTTVICQTGNTTQLDSKAVDMEISPGFKISAIIRIA